MHMLMNCICDCWTTRAMQLSAWLWSDSLRRTNVNTMQLPCNNRKTFWSNLADWEYYYAKNKHIDVYSINALSMSGRRQKQEQMTTWSQVEFATVLFRTDPWGDVLWGGWSVGSWLVVPQILSILVSHESQNPKGFQKVPGAPKSCV